MRKIFLFITLSIILILMCSCEPVSDHTVTPTPQMTTPSVDTTTAPVVTDTNVSTNTETPSVTPTPTEDETFWDEDKILETGGFYGTAFETWPFEDNGTWCPRAYLQSCLIIHSSEADFSENYGTDDYEYTWQIYYFEKGEVPKSYDDMKGPYTASMNTLYKFDLGEPCNIIYRAVIGECPEGQFTKDLVIDVTYTFYVEIKKGNEISGCFFADQIWNNKYAAYRDVYYRFWEKHDRSLGITSGTHKVTDEDRKDAIDLGFDEKAKPVIYLYPEEPTDVSVKLDVSGELAFTYPAYNDGWNVTAYPDGTLIDKATGREYSYLFWESYSYSEYDLSKGFVVKGEDTAEFLQDILGKIGLTPREYNEMIVYWLPKMQHNKYNLITFQTEAYTEEAKLYIDPSPDSLLRVFMVFKSLDEPIEIEEPEFETFERVGFTVVEWGGTDLG